MLPVKILKQMELEIEAIENSQGGDIPSEQWLEIQAQTKDVEVICEKNHQVFMLYKVLFEDSFGIPLEKFWQDDYNGFKMGAFVEFIKEKYPDYTDYQGPKALVLDKVGPEANAMMVKLNCDLADERQNGLHDDGKCNIGDALDGLTQEGMDLDDLPPELRKLFGL